MYVTGSEKTGVSMNWIGPSAVSGKLSIGLMFGQKLVCYQGIVMQQQERNPKVNKE